MIGQKDLYNRLLNMEVPNFLILEGENGSGRHTIIKSICLERYIECVMLEDSKVDTIRATISQAYKTNSKRTIFVIPDGEDMSPSAKNALLKVTEEPPELSSFVLLVNSVDSVPDTLRSRAFVEQMDMYTPSEIQEYLVWKYPNVERKQIEEIVNIADVPGEVDALMAIGVDDFIKYTDLVINNIATTSDANAFKIGGKIALKKGADGYDLRLFWKCLISEAHKRFVENNGYRDFSVALNLVKITTQYLQRMKNTSLNKQALFDMWIVDVRKFTETLDK